MNLEDTYAIIHGVDTCSNFEFAIHMREVALVNSIEIMFSGCTCGERVAILRTILCYLKAILTNI